MAGHECNVCLTEDPDGKRNPRPVVNTRKALWCATHRRAEDTRQRKAKRGKSVEAKYDITEADNHQLYLFQGGRCWLCRKATGATKSLAVDHDHKTDEVRGRLCGPCNQFIGKLGDSAEAAQRLVAYLTGDTPYRRLKAAHTLASAPGLVPEYIGSLTVHCVIERADYLVAEWSSQYALSSRWQTVVRTKNSGWGIVGQTVLV